EKTMQDLKVSVESAEGLARRIRVQVPAAHVEREITARLKTIARSTHLKGFRPGKVPETVLRERFGAQVRREVVQELVRASYTEAMARETVQPAGEPRIDVPPDAGAQGSDLAYTVSFEIFPEFEIKGLQAIAVTRRVLAIDDADMDFVIENLRRQRGKVQAVDRPAREGDHVTVSVSSGEPVSIVLGAGHFGADFEKQLIGFRAGEERTINTTLGGRHADFAVRVSAVAEEHLPEVDENFIRGFDVESGDHDEFLQQVREYMRIEFESRAEADVKRQLLDFLLEKNPISVPAALVEKEAMTVQAGAERRVRLRLLIDAIVRDQGLAEDQVIQWLTGRATVTSIPASFRSLKDH
ncbi:MAG: trigger factor, partial [Gammaproteobacteria bacterium]